MRVLRLGDKVVQEESVDGGALAAVVRGVEPGLPVGRIHTRQVGVVEESGMTENVFVIVAQCHGQYSLLTGGGGGGGQHINTQIKPRLL